MGWKNTHETQHISRVTVPRENRSSQMTSCALSRRDKTNDFAATQLSILCHRLFQDLAASACNSSGRSRTFAKVSSETNWTVSADHVPPVAVASTTILARPPSPACSGYVLSWSFRAISSATPGLRDAPRRAVPSLKSGRPPATTSRRLASRLLCASTSMYRTKTFVLTRAPASRQTLAATDSSAQPLRPNTPADAHAARWWPHRQQRKDKARGRPRRRSKSRNG